MKWWNVSPRECGESVIFLAASRSPARETGPEGRDEVEDLKTHDRNIRSD
jgi:hypothetical protein